MRPRLQLGLKLLMLSALFSGLIMLGYALAFHPALTHFSLFGEEPNPYRTVGTLGVVGWVNFALNLVGLWLCLDLPPESDSRRLVYFTAAATVACRMLTLQANLPIWMFSALGLMGDLALLLFLARVAVYYRRRDLLLPFGVGAVVTTVQSATQIAWGSGAAFWVCMAAGLIFSLVVPFAAGRLAQSVGDGPPREEFI